jgi:hypothetical protein
MSGCGGRDNNLNLLESTSTSTPESNPVEATWSTIPEPISDVVAFPGAEGGGMYTTGGRGGKTLFVTSLEDTNTEGTLRWAVSQNYPRIIVFKVSGIIQLENVLNIKNGNLTIAGQSAPGDGICIRDYGVYINCDNVIIRYLRIRLGDEKNQADDAFCGRYCKNILLDHCSVSWGVDECASFYANENFTMQWCIISESLNVSVHGKGPHGFGGIWGGINASFHHNLLAHHDNRNPRFDSPVVYAEGMTQGNVDYRNNVVYNWGTNNTYGGEGGKFNMVANYYKPGPASHWTIKWFINTIGAYTGIVNNVPDVMIYSSHARLYMEGNYFTLDSIGMNNNNWKGVKSSNDGGSKDGMRLTSPLSITANGKACYVTTHTADDAYAKVLNFAGASLHRDKDDLRVVNDTRSGCATVIVGSKGSENGLIDSQNDVGGWDVYNSTAYPSDTDGDGIPDIWEMDNGLDKNRPGDSYARTLDPLKKLTNLDVYLNSLVEDIEREQNAGGRKINL